MVPTYPATWGLTEVGKRNGEDFGPFWMLKDGFEAPQVRAGRFKTFRSKVRWRCAKFRGRGEASQARDMTELTSFKMIKPRGMIYTCR